jgi:hypothetical protein
MSADLFNYYDDQYRTAFAELTKDIEETEEELENA